MFTVQLTVSVKRQDDVVQLAFDLCFDDEEILSILLPQWEQDEKVISYEIRSGVGV
jgi:protein subunit release factor A